MLRLLLKLLVTVPFALMLNASLLHAQFTSGSSVEGLVNEIEQEDQAEGEGTEEESNYVKGIRMDVFIKNSSSFGKTLTGYDNVCRRYVFSVKRFGAYQKERVKVCLDEEGFGDVTISRLAGSQKKRYKQIKEREIVRYP